MLKCTVCTYKVTITYNVYKQLIPELYVMQVNLLVLKLMIVGMKIRYDINSYFLRAKIIGENYYNAWLINYANFIIITNRRKAPSMINPKSNENP